MEKMSDVVAAIRTAFADGMATVQDTDALDALRVRTFGKKGTLTAQLKALGKLPAEERPLWGEKLNALRQELEAQLDARRKELTARELEQAEAQERVDVTLPAASRPFGSLHPVVQTMHEIVDIMRGMGFSVALGPEKEEERYNFDALNMPSWHPARDMQDTFYFPDGTLLRTHTSPVQVRSMLRYGAPIRIVCPGKVYRRDNDPTHSPMFNQLEGLMLDEDVAFSELKGTLAALMNAFFGKTLKNRFRASYFPFTEPSMELDIECVDCSGKNCHCRICKGTGWLEVCGMGMVHPAVLHAGNIDPERYNGFAFGLGLDRMAMLKYHIADLRLLFDGNVSYFLSDRNALGGEAR